MTEEGDSRIVVDNDAALRKAINKSASDVSSRELERSTSEASTETNSPEKLLQVSKITAHSLSPSQKWWLTVMLGAAFFIISSRPLYSVTHIIVYRSFVSTENGPSLVTLLIHTVIFMVIARLILH